MRIEKLDGDKLNYWVGRALGYFPERRRSRDSMEEFLVNTEGKLWLMHPSQNFESGGRIIEDKKIATAFLGNLLWYAFEFGKSIGYDSTSTDIRMGISSGYFGETLLIAAMRCVVASKFGDEVPDD